MRTVLFGLALCVTCIAATPDLGSRPAAIRGASPGLDPPPNSRESEAGVSGQIRGLPGGVRRARRDLQNRRRSIRWSR
jgi:hypothetical protein